MGPEQGPLCLLFYYQLQGEAQGSLRVLLRDSDQEETLLWALKGDQGSHWKEGRTILPQSPKEYQVCVDCELTAAVVECDLVQVLKCRFKVLVIFTTLLFSCLFILLLHYIAEENCIFFLFWFTLHLTQLLHSFTRYLLHKFRFLHTKIFRSFRYSDIQKNMMFCSNS